MKLNKTLLRLLIAIMLAIPTGALMGVTWDAIFDNRSSFLRTLILFIPGVFYAMFYFLMSVVFFSTNTERQAHEWIAIGFAVNCILLVMPWTRLKNFRISN